MIDFDNENIIISNLLRNPAFSKKVILKLKNEDFEDYINKIIFKNYKDFYLKFEKFPTLKELGVKILNLKEVKNNNELKENIIKKIKEIKNDEIIKNIPFLIDLTNETIKKKRFIDELLKASDDIAENKDLTKYLEKFEKALKFKLENDLGISVKDFDKKFELYQINDEFISTGVSGFDEIMGGGFKKKALTVFSAPSNYGKTAFMIFFAGKLIKNGYNGIYYSLEMPMEDISKRIDASLTGIPINDISKLSKEEYKKVFENLKIPGELFIKDYPANTLTVFDIEMDIAEIENITNKKIDFIVVDYLGIAKSVRAKFSQGPYLYYKAVAEELHALSKKLGIATITSSQLNRSAFNNTNAGMAEVSDSIGVVQTADNFISIVSNEELFANKELILKFEKSRSNTRGNKLLVKFDFARVNFEFNFINGKNASNENIETIKNQINNTDIEELQKTMFNKFENNNNSVEKIDDFDEDLFNEIDNF